MSEQNTSQESTEDVVVNDVEINNIGNAAEEKVEDKGPKPIYEDKSDEKTEEVKPESKDGEAEEVGEKKDEGEGDKTEEKVEDYKSLEKPDDSLLSEADMERILDQSKKEGLSKEAAQKRVDLANGILKNHAESNMQRLSELRQDWVKQCRTDKEIGGENFEKSVELARRTVQRFGTEDFMKALNDTGFGNNPEVIRVFARIGKEMSNDTFVKPGSQVKEERTLEQIFYGKQN